MNTKDTGGPAFPYLTASESRQEITTHEGEHGMTLRDYFAAKAMPSVMADWREDRVTQANGDFDDDVLVMARDCYQMADAMLKARNA